MLHILIVFSLHFGVCMTVKTLFLIGLAEQLKTISWIQLYSSFFINDSISWIVIAVEYVITEHIVVVAFN